ncbi:MAG TPA: glycerate kinase [Saprospiraceae bacterium]|nr:glycerate kinase [Saprospiraceae bacterium]
MKKVLIIPDKFKGSITSKEICQVGAHVANGFELKTRIIPVADGGDGSLDVLLEVLGLQKITIHTYDALMQRIMAYYGLDVANRTAYIEMAKTSGLSLIDLKDRDVMKATTYGTGLMIADAIERGVEQIYIFIGGSATNDAALGCAQALGFKILDRHFDEIDANGQNLIKIKHIKKTKKALPKITIVSDVDNILHGPEGAAYVYAKQKGATDDQVKYLDQGLKNVSSIFDNFVLGVSQQAGSGAAGGFGGGAIALLGANIVNGFEFISSVLQIEDAITSTDIVITGEGGLDIQSFYGKIVGKIIDLARKHERKCYVICGRIDDKHEVFQKIDREMVCILSKKANDTEDAIFNVEKYLAICFEEIYDNIQRI